MDVRRDGEFLRLGTLASREDGTLVAFFDATYLKPFLANPKIAAVLTTPDLAHLVPAELAMAVTENPMAVFIELHFHLVETRFYWEDRPTVISASAKVHTSTVIAENNVSIGRNVLIEPHVTIFEGVEIGDDTRIRAGSILGNQHNERWTRHGVPVAVPHDGGVRVGRNVDIFCNAVIDRNIFNGTTDIGDGTMVCNLVNIGHGSKVGRRCVIRPTVMVCGFVLIGDDVDVAPGVTISNGLVLGDGARVVIGETVTKDVPAHMVYVNRSTISIERWEQIRLAKHRAD